MWETSGVKSGCWSALRDCESRILLRRHLALWTIVLLIGIFASCMGDCDSRNLEKANNKEQAERVNKE